MSDAEKFQLHLDYFAAALESTADLRSRGATPSAESLLAVVGRLPQETEKACRERCERVVRAFAYVEKNRRAFQNIEALLPSADGSVVITSRAIFGLYLFFGSGSTFANSEPQLDLVLGAIIQSEEGP